ncbi:hypothetical protein ACIG56_24220 [Nocardia fusca]|uniref:hypothetical protein n=1 Tax=Nocardia fusca TaxID=941183 RepID=UPI0037C564B6
MIRAIVDQVRRRLLARLGPEDADGSAAVEIAGNYRKAGSSVLEARAVEGGADTEGSALLSSGRDLCPPPPDRVTVTRARQELDVELRQRFGEDGLDDDDWETLLAERWPALRQYAMIDRHIEEVAASLGRDSAAVREQMRHELKTALAGKPLAIRVRENELATILREGRLRGDPTPGGPRAAAEAEWFGPQVHKNPPVYGYVAVDGVRPSQTGRIDALSELNYGNHQIYLKPEVRERTTITVGDSVVEKERSIPSPLENPSEYSYGAGMSASRVGLIDRDYTGAQFRSDMFVEAQMFDVTVADIDFIALHEPPRAELRQALDQSGVQWRVLTNQTIAAEGSPAERAAAIERTSQDLTHIRNYWLDFPPLSGDVELEAELSADLRALREATAAEGKAARPEQ